MTPQGLSKHTTTYNDIFSLPIPAVKTLIMKRKSEEGNPNRSTLKKRKASHKNFIPDIEVITIDSDASVSDDDTAKGSKEITANSNSDNESIKIYEHENETITIDDSETDDNVVINISQTVNVDKIVDSALGRDIAPHSSSFCNGENNSNGKNTIKKVHWTKANDYPKSWTKEMIRYYTEPCEKNRYFDYEEILRKIKTKASDWWINRADMIGPSRRRSISFCRKCGKNGHVEKECSKIFVCYTCGEYNHLFSNCPNTRCLTCGRQTSRNLMRCDSCDRALRKKRACGLCGQISHEEIMCPSKWRKYLLPESSNQTMRLNPKRCCYNCAQQGHFGFECPFTQNSSYPLENPLLTAYFDNTNDTNNNNVIFLSKETANLLCSQKGNDFFERLSKSTNCRIEFFRGVQDYVRIIGEENQMPVFEEELQKLKTNADSLR